MASRSLIIAAPRAEKGLDDDLGVLDVRAGLILRAVVDVVIGFHPGFAEVLEEDAEPAVEESVLLSQRSDLVMLEVLDPGRTLETSTLCSWSFAQTA